MSKVIDIEKINAEFIADFDNKVAQRDAEVEAVKHNAVERISNDASYLDLLEKQRLEREEHEVKFVQEEVNAVYAKHQPVLDVYSKFVIVHEPVVEEVVSEEVHTEV